MQLVNGTMEAVSFQEALERANMNFEIGLSHVWTKTNTNELLPVLGHFATYRKDNGQPLNAIVGNRYNVIQHNALHGIVDPIIQPLNAKIVNAGFLKHGKLFFFQSKMPNTWKIGNNDLIDSYFTLTGSHDGSTHLSIGFSNIRIICQNTFVLASAQASKTLLVRHTANADMQLLNGENIIKSVLQYHEGVKVKAQSMLETKFSDKQLDIALNKIFNDKDNTRALNNMNKIRENFNNGLGIDSTNRGSLWCAVNAITQFSDHEKSVKKEKENPIARFESNLIGSSAQFKTKAIEILEQVSSLSI